MASLIEISRPTSALVALIRTMRPHQWVKNLACFAGLLFSGQLIVPASLGSAALAFGCFCLASSAIYIFNDICDRRHDRLNPRTADRPLASGAVPVWIFGIGFVLLTAGAGVIAAALGRSCLMVLAAYVLLNLGYSLAFKYAVVADVMCIAFGFVLRVLFGVYAVQVKPSPWIVLCMFFLALFLAFGKRRSELADLGEEARAVRIVLRQYTRSYLDLAIGITATITILTYTLFSVSGQHDPTMVITIMPVVYCVLRYVHQVIVVGAGQSPEALLLKDKMMWLGVAAWLVLCILVLYADLRLIEFTNR